MSLRPRDIRRMGFLSDQEGIMNRYLREGTQWESHLQSCRRFIARSFAGQSLESVAVLGSGWLLDVPLEELTKRFKRVILADIRHPAQVRRKVRNLPSVELVTCDLSGGAVARFRDLVESGGKGWDIPADFTLEWERPAALPQTDALVSVNLLSQLPVLLEEYLQRKAGKDRILPLSLHNQIQRAHLQWITGAPGCLITDVEEIRTHRNGETRLHPLVHGPLPAGIRSGQWIWHFDQSGYYLTDHRVDMQVRAVEWEGPPGV